LHGVREDEAYERNYVGRRLWRRRLFPLVAEESEFDRPGYFIDSDDDEDDDDDDDDDNDIDDNDNDANANDDDDKKS